MATAEPGRNATFVAVPCRCGRVLRAKFGQVGTEIRCWDCHEMVVVPNPHLPGESARALAEGWGAFARVKTQMTILGATLLVVLAMMVPGYGVVASGVALAVVASGLIGRMLERISRGDSTAEPSEIGHTAVVAIARAAIAASMAAGTVVPLWVRNSDLHRSPRWDAAGLALFAATWFAFPLATMMAFGRDRRGFLGVREGLRMAARHPVLILLVLSIVPLALVASEVLLLLGTLWQGSFPFLALDLFPMPGKPEVVDGVPMYNHISFRQYGTARFYQGYLDALGRGYSFAGALPASLMRPTSHELNSYAIGISSTTYRILRGVGSALVVGPMLWAATLQACWLGGLAAVRQRRASA